MTMTLVELSFPVTGAALPEDNGYGLFAAISHALGGHLPEGVAVASIGGAPLGRWRMRVDRATRLRIRLPADRIGEVLQLAGKFLDVGGHEIGLGIPQVRALEASPELASRLVTIKGFTEPGPFLEAAGRQLEALGVSGHAAIPAVPGGPRRGLPQRRVISIKGRRIVGFAVAVGGLSARDSATLLARGLGGRRHMGCGIFAPARRAEGAGHGT